MGFGGNFVDDVNLSGDILEVGGSSESLDGMCLVSRSIAVRQGGSYAVASAPGVLKWEIGLEITNELAPSGFTAGPAVAIGSETHLVVAPDSAFPPAFATVTWSEPVTIG